MKIKYILYCFLFVSLFFISCDNDTPIDKEQYFKQVYIVGATDVVKVYDVKYNNEPTNSYITLATGGSLNVDKDVSVTVEDDENIIDWYNNKYMIDEFIKYQILDEKFYDIPSYSTIIKKGTVYSRLPFDITTAELSCDSLYALTFKIKSVSDYQKNEKDTVLIMNINLVNDFSGIYQMEATRFNINEEGEEVFPTTLTTSRELKAVNESTIRFFNETKNEQKSAYRTRDEYFNSIEDNCLTFKHEGENLFSVHSWKNLEVIEGIARYSYDEFLTSSTIVFSYDYKKDGTHYRLKGTMKK